jgi:septal ring factor EnvC (AmiA/AmiB activator)
MDPDEDDEVEDPDEVPRVTRPASERRAAAARRARRVVKSKEEKKKGEPDAVPAPARNVRRNGTPPPRPQRVAPSKPAEAEAPGQAE